MSENMKTGMEHHTLIQFWGGDDKGVCLQVTASTPLEIKSAVMEQLQVEGFIQLTMEEAAVLRNDLARFIREEANRRRDLLRWAISDMEQAERVAYDEVLGLPSNMGLGENICISMVSSLCPKYRKEIYKDGMD